MIDHVFADMEFAYVYLDNFMVFSTNLEEHLEHVSAVISGSAKYGLKLKLENFHHAQGQIGLLSHLAGVHGFQVDPSKFVVIQAITSPSTICKYVVS